MIDDLYQSDLFQRLNPTELRHFEPELEKVTLAGGAVLFREGDPSEDGLYVVTSGRLLATALDAEGRRKALRELGRGEAFGELGLISGKPRRATIRALRDSTLLRLSNTGFRQLVDKHPHTTLLLARTIIERFEDQAQGHRPEGMGTLVILPLAPYPWLGELSLRLAASLARLGETALVRAPAVDHQFGPGAAQSEADDPRQPQVAEWLDLLESQHHYVVYLADAEATAWTRRCLRHADRILLVTARDEPPTRSVLEDLVATQRTADVPPPRTELALVETGSSRGTSSVTPWLVDRSLHTHHLVHLGDRAQLDRLARRLTDRAIGLVLGGGGSRAIAHIGVIRALEEARVPIDLVAATSAGAIVGAMFAMGWDSHAIEERVRELARLRHWVFDFGPPVVSFLGGRGIAAGLRGFYGEQQLEDLAVPLRALSASLMSGRAVVPDRGPLWTAVRASLPLPAVWPPLERDGDLLVDGGLLDNLPAVALQATCAGGKVIASSVSQSTLDIAASQFGRHLSPWRALAALLAGALPFTRRRKMPLLPEIVLRTASLASARRSEETVRSMVDLYLEPEVSGFGMFEVNNRALIEEVIAIGYHHTRDRLDRWTWQQPLGGRPAAPRPSAR